MGINFTDGERVKATTTITDLSGDDPGYAVNPGDTGTVRSAGTLPPSTHDFAVEWDRFPGILNAVDAALVAPADADFGDYYGEIIDAFERSEHFIKGRVVNVSEPEEGHGVVVVMSPPDIDSHGAHNFLVSEDEHGSYSFTPAG